jgi:hypothetical protein
MRPVLTRGMNRIMLGAAKAGNGAAMLKFDFSVQTRDGSKIVSVVIAGRDREDAERKLRQMYRDCQILSCEIRPADERQKSAASLEDILSIISK